MRTELLVSEKHQRRFWSKVGLPDENGCMLWHGLLSARQGYGRVFVGSHQQAHRVSLYLAEGASPEDGMHAAHSCLNKSCVAPAHLRWATAKENEADKAIQGIKPLGERVGSAKLTNAQAEAIRGEAKQGVPHRELRERYGVSKRIITRIISGRTYRTAGVAKVGA